MLRRLLRLTAGSDLARQYKLGAVRTVADFRRSLPLVSYEDVRPIIDRLCNGETHAVFAPRTRIRMFATSSGTTAAPKRIPVTAPFIADYRRGWNTFGLKMLQDHPRAILRPILQSSGRHDESRTPAGVPCGAITGLLARTQKRIVRRFYVGRPEIAQIPDPRGRYYTLIRLGVGRDVAFAITANPATLIQMAHVADEMSETLIRDVRDGTLSTHVVADPALNRRIAASLRPDPTRAHELARSRDRRARLHPRDFWDVVFLACWIGGSLGHYLPRLRELWGNVPVRDVGLLASEGRVSIPLEDNTPVGVLDVTAGIFEFIPAAQAEVENPDVVSAGEVAVGEEYIVVLSNTSGLLRYRLDDVVRVHGRIGKVPTVEFLYRAGRVASVAGEKLTENQVVAAVGVVAREKRIAVPDFLMAPEFADPPFYRLWWGGDRSDGLSEALDGELRRQNEEYDSRRKSGRLGMLRIDPVDATRLREIDQALQRRRGGMAEQYKRACLLTEVGEAERLLGEGHARGAGEQ